MRYIVSIDATAKQKFDDVSARDRPGIASLEKIRDMEQLADLDSGADLLDTLALQRLCQRLARLLSAAGQGEAGPRPPPSLRNSRIRSSLTIRARAALRMSGINSAIGFLVFVESGLQSSAYCAVSGGGCLLQISD